MTVIPDDERRDDVFAGIFVNADLFGREPIGQSLVAMGTIGDVVFTLDEQLAAVLRVSPSINPNPCRPGKHQPPRNLRWRQGFYDQRRQG